MPRETIVRVARKGSIFTESQAKAMERIVLDDDSPTDLATQVLDAIGVRLDDCCDGISECDKCRQQRELKREEATDDHRAGA
jgi:hypothetical protein